MKRTIYSNDVCETYDYIKNYLEEFFPDLDEDEEVNDDEIWSRAYDEIEIRLGDEEANLDVDTNGQIILVGTIERWNGAFPVYKLLKTQNVGEAMKEAMASFGGDNTFEIYVNEGKMYLSQTGHDNPTNPSIVEFRELTDDFDELEDDRPDTLLKKSKSLAPYACNVYGWEVA